MLIVAALLLAWPLNAQEDLKLEIARVAAIANSVERLAAFDAFAARIGAAPRSQIAEKKASRWQVETETSAVDDSVIVTATLYADESVRIGYSTGRPSLILRYKEGRISAFVVFDAFLGSDEIKATVRFGKEPAVTEEWNVSTDHKAAFVRGDAMAFIRKLAAVDSFLIRVTPYSESPVTVLFSPVGVDQIIPEIEKAAAQRKK